MAGGGGGTIHHMVTTIKNNKALLKRRSIFKKDRSLFHVRQEYVKASKGKLDYKKASKEEILALRKKLIRRRKINTAINILILSAITIAVFGSAYNFFKKEEQKTTAYNKAQKERAKLRKQEDLEIYNYLLKEADYLLSRKEWKKAVSDYIAALRIYPDAYETELKLAKAYCLYCYDYPPACAAAEKYLDNLIYFYPDSLILYEQRAHFRLNRGNKARAEEDFKIIDLLKK